MLGWRRKKNHQPSQWFTSIICRKWFLFSLRQFLYTFFFKSTHKTYLWFAGEIPMLERIQQQSVTKVIMVWTGFCCFCLISEKRIITFLRVYLYSDDFSVWPNDRKLPLIEKFYYNYSTPCAFEVLLIDFLLRLLQRKCFTKQNTKENRCNEMGIIQHLYFFSNFKWKQLSFRIFFFNS